MAACRALGMVAFPGVAAPVSKGVKPAQHASKTTGNEQ
jgi:hypothetical protein